MVVRSEERGKGSVTLPGSCAVCWERALFFCPECHLVGYCCISHMERHWKAHDELCVVAKRIMSENTGSLFRGRISDDNDWRQARVNVIVKSTRLLKRDLHAYERDLLLFPKSCTCYESDFKKLSPCRHCNSAWHCRDDPNHLKNSHREWCPKLSFYSDFVRRQMCGEVVEFDSETFRPNSMKILPGDDISKVIRSVVDDELDDYKIAVISQLASGPLTVLYGLKESGYRNYKGGFVVHLIGAEVHYEGSALQAWEYFFLHHVPEVTKLKIVMVGPELGVDRKVDCVKLCSECVKRKRKLIVEYQDGLLYHEYAKNGKHTKPNLVCAFNPGLHRYTGFDQKDTWPLTIKKAVANNCPFVFTAYTSYEAPLDLARVKECATVHTIHPPTKNPFASLKPDRNFISDHEVPLIYKNYYVTIVSLAI